MADGATDKASTDTAPDDAYNLPLPVENADPEGEEDVIDPAVLQAGKDNAR